MRSIDVLPIVDTVDGYVVEFGFGIGLIGKLF